MKVWEWTLVVAMWLIAGALWISGRLRPYLQRRRFQELAEAHAAELVTCPVCLKGVPRSQTQITPVKQITEPRQSKRYMKEPVCDDCEAWGKWSVERPLDDGHEKGTR